MTKIKASEIFKLKDLDKKWKWVTRDEDGLTTIFNIKPTKSKDFWTMHDECFCISELFNDLELDFGTNDWTKCIAERPIDYNNYIGKLVIVSNLTDEKYKTIGILEAYSFGDVFPFKVEDYWFKDMRPLTKEEIEKLTNYGE